MSDRLNVIALISGGKDSLFSLLHCTQNGHNVVALANLYPPSQTSGEAPCGHHVRTTAQDRDWEPHSSRLVDYEDSDLNSFMYQTVGYSLIPLYAIALQLPLYRRQITGTSILQSQDYDSSDHRFDADETEDLIPLLREIMSAHPEANAVSTGAILSTYQRTRVESITVRMGLTPLSFLWQYPILPSPLGTPTFSSQSGAPRLDSLTGLLEDIASAGVDARIIKIASAGIPEQLLFANVADPRTQSRLLNGLAPFFEENDEIGLRGAVLGEGGEYETIALNGPKALWRGGRIEVDESANETFSEGGVTYVRFGRAKVVPHDEEKIIMKDEDRSSNSNLVPTPGSLDPQFEKVRTNLRSFENLSGKDSPFYQQPSIIPASTSASHSDHLLTKPARPHLKIACASSTGSITISNITSLSILAYLEPYFKQSSTSSTDGKSSSASSSSSLYSLPSAATQFQTILSQLPALFTRITRTYGLPSLSTKNITSTTLLLSSISDFAIINPIYSQLWPTGFPNPPARVTIAAPLSNTRISLSLALDLCPPSQRQGLHVQGRSYWAPANIGPYSQAIAVPLVGAVQSEKVTTHNDEGNEDEPGLHKLKAVHIAGQIPLIPCNMQVHPGPFLDTAILSLQHLWRIGQERKVDIWPWAVAYLAEGTSTVIRTLAHTSAAIWREAHLKPTWTVPQDDDNDSDDITSDNENEDSTVDVWDLQYNRSLHHGFRPSNMSVGKHRHVLPNHSLLYDSNKVNTISKSKSRTKHIPPFLAAEVIALPRNVSVEWWSHGIAGLAKSSSMRLKPTWQSKSLPWGTISSLTIADATPPTRSDTVIAVKFISCFVSSDTHTNIDSIPNTLAHFIQILNDDNSDNRTELKLAQGTAFVTYPTATSASSSSSTSIWKHFTSTLESLGNMTTTIPCHRLFSQIKGSNTTDVTDGPKETEIAFLLRVEVVQKA